MKTTDRKGGAFRRFKAFSLARITHSSGGGYNRLTHWRARILFNILFAGLLLGLALFLPVTALIIKKNLWGLAVFDGSVWLIAFSLLILRRPTYEMRAGITLLLAFSIGVGILFLVGPLSGGPIWLFAFACLTGVLLGSKAAILALSMNTILITFVGWFVSSGRFGTFIFSSPEAMWTAGANFILLNAVIAISVGVLTEGLATTHRKEKDLMESLSEEHLQLIRAKKRLEKEVEERRQTEKALTQSETKFRIMFESAPDAYYMHDLKGRMIDGNRAAENILGYKMHELVGKNVLELDLLTRKDLSRIKKVITKLSSGETIGPAEFVIKRKDDTKVITEIRATPIHINGEDLVFGVARDITARKKLEEHFHQAQRLESIGTLAGGMAHDFNNLLMGIQGRTSLLLLDKETPLPHANHLKKIEDCIHSAVGLTKQLLGFARGGKYEVKAISLNRLIERSAEMFGRTKKEIQIHIKRQQDLWAVEVDQGQIEQVLMNLYVNAGQAMPGGGDMVLETANATLDHHQARTYGIEPGKYVKVSVSDNGVGMNKTVQERVFDPFFTTRDRGRGTGLGLASAYGIIKNHGGMIHVHSFEGEGTTFTFFLPASEKEIIKEEVAMPNIRKGAETILLVDDEEMIVDVGMEMLKRLGYHVLSATSGQEALDTFQKHQDHIDLVLLDLIMPGMGGGKTYDQLKSINPEIKVLLSSGYSLDGQATEILNRGCNGFIQKPFNTQTLSQKIRETLEN